MTGTTEGGLPSTTEDGAVAKYGTRGNVSIAGQKGVSLEGAQSADIRERLMQMIAEREQGNPMQEALGHLALAGSVPGEFNRNYSDYLTRKRQQEQDLLGMRVSAGQLASEEARLRQVAARQKAFQDQLLGYAGVAPQTAAPAPAITPQPTGAATQPRRTVSPAQWEISDVPSWDRPPTNFPLRFDPNNPMRGAPDQPTPTGALPVAQQQPAGALPARPPLLTPVQASTINQLFASGPKGEEEALKQLLAITNPTETERLAASAGLTPGTPEHSAFMRAKIAGSGAFVPHDVRGPSGTMQQTPMDAITSGLRPAAPAAPTATTAAPAAPAAAVAAPAAPAAAAPRPAAPTPAPVSTGFAPGSREDLAARQRAIEVQQDIEKEVALEQNRKIAVPEQTALSETVKQAPTNLILSQSLVNDVKAHPDLFGKLMQPTIWSSAANLLDTGVQIGQLGSVSIPGIKDFVQQLDPAAAKDTKKLEAWTRIIGNMAKVKLGYAQLVLKGQGAVSDNERRLIDTAVGDPSRDSAKNMLMKAKAIEVEARNAMEQNSLWEKSRDKMNWAQFKASPQYKEMQRAQFYRTAKVFKIDNAKWPGDE